MTFVFLCTLNHPCVTGLITHRKVRNGFVDYSVLSVAVYGKYFTFIVEGLNELTENYTFCSISCSIYAEVNIECKNDSRHTLVTMVFKKRYFKLIPNLIKKTNPCIFYPNNNVQGMTLKIISSIKMVIIIFLICK